MAFLSQYVDIPQNSLSYDDQECDNNINVKESSMDRLALVLLNFDFFIYIIVALYELIDMHGLFIKFILNHSLVPLQEEMCFFHNT